jgi:hypothetical protein
VLASSSCSSLAKQGERGEREEAREGMKAAAAGSGIQASGGKGSRLEGERVKPVQSSRSSVGRPVLELVKLGRLCVEELLPSFLPSLLLPSLLCCCCPIEKEKRKIGIKDFLLLQFPAAAATAVMTTTSAR